jgi:cytochrome bd-type quinol oxidase subunit 2
MWCRSEIAKLKKPGTAIAATAWLVVSAYLYLVLPSLAALVDTLDSVPSAVDRLIQLPRVAFLALGLLAVFGLTLKDRWLRAPLALAIDAVIGAPAFLVIVLLLYPFVVPAE